MGRYEFQEVGDFHVVTHAVKKSDNCWAAFAFIDRRADSSKAVAPAVRLHVPQESSTEWGALKLAALHAAQSIRRGEIDL